MGDFKFGVGVGVGEPEKASEPSSTPAFNTELEVTQYLLTLTDWFG